MNTKEYIASGILEKYALGLCSDAEKCRVETLSEFFPEIKQELNAVMQSVEMYGIANAIEPPAHLKQKITQAIFSNPEETPKTTALPVKNTPSLYYYFAAAAAVALLISTIALYYMLSDSEKRVNELSEKNENFKLSIDSLENIYRQLNADFAFHKDINSKHIILTAVATSAIKDAKMMVCWNEKMEKVCVELINMPAPPQGKQYQLWAIVNGKPVDAGIMPTDLKGEAMMPLPDVKNAQAFAVTIENIGGSATPTMTQMVVMGKV